MARRYPYDSIEYFPYLQRETVRYELSQLVVSTTYGVWGVINMQRNCTQYERHTYAHTHSVIISTLLGSGTCSASWAYRARAVSVRLAASAYFGHLCARITADLHQKCVHCTSHVAGTASFYLTTHYTRALLSKHCIVRVCARRGRRSLPPALELLHTTIWRR